jgi:PIN domain nuclease of toxin-antitoxin system
MKYLLDSGIWFWSISTEHKINSQGLEILADGKQALYLSAATTWELGIKMRLGKLQLPSPPAQCIPAYMARQRLLPLPVSHLHAASVYDLELHHGDPFDRLIIAQALVEGMTILTADRIFEKYPVEVLWCGK